MNDFASVSDVMNKKRIEGLESQLRDFDQIVLQLTEERNMLAYKNKAMAETLEKLGYDVDSLIFKHREG